jgi:hypothetical protein
MRMRSYITAITLLAKATGCIQNQGFITGVGSGSGSGSANQRTYAL